MTKMKSTKRAMLLSALSLLLCVSMLIGTTFAWFTDSVTSGRNVIQSGNLDVELEYFDGSTWKPVTESTNVFGYNLWEPGFTKVVKFRVTNAGSLALKYQLTADVYAETAGVNKDGQSFNLSDYLYTATVDEDATREEILATTGVNLKNSYELGAKSLAVNAASDVFALAIWMPTTVGNEANHNGTNVPKIEFGINLIATQDTVEADSFDNQYDDIALVSNAVELKEAIANGGDIMLAADIAVDANTTMTVPADKEVNLNLNGKTISAVSSETGRNRPVFTVKGEMNVIGNGTVTQKHTGANMAWGNLTAPFSVESGELTIGKGVTVANLGGTDMAYAVDVNTTLGESVLNVDGAVLYSSYIGVRIFNNNNNANGIVNFNDGVIEGGKKGYDIWAQLMSAPAENAIVNIDSAFTYTTMNSSGTIYLVESDVNFVSSPAQVAEALSTGGNYVLMQDVELAKDETVVVGAGVETNLALNGHTLSAANTRTETHNDMILVNGGTLNISNGTVAMEHTGANMGWNGATSVIDITAGGVVNLNGVTVKNEGGTDMNFSVHMNNWGEVTLNADNCVFEAPYCAVRVFNSGPQDNNVKITNSTLIGGTRAFWVHNYGSSDFGDKVYSGATAAYDKAVVDARLNLDIYNNNNIFTITGTAKSPIRYGFNSTVYYDANGNQVL